MSASPTWDEIEEFWGYRSVEKTPLDLQKWGSSRDMGVALRGHLDAEKRFGYHVMAGNGSETKQETNKTKKYYLALDAKPGGGFYVQAYGDYEANKSVTPGSSVGTYQIFGGWKTGRGRVGLQYAHQWRGVTGGPDKNLNLVSAFGVAKLTERWSALARWDYHMDYNPDLAGGILLWLQRGWKHQCDQCQEHPAGLWSGLFPSGREGPCDSQRRDIRVRPKRCER